MSVKPFFLDTNLLVYGYSAQDIRKRDIAQRLITSGFAVTSVQTLNELCNVLRRKFPEVYFARLKFADLAASRGMRCKAQIAQCGRST